ncbi:hypothetical protein N7513_006436 [Penicillium frequentans]|nr:hypothetical protein N7513_006436 [Penicillium glabrum]
MDAAALEASGINLNLTSIVFALACASFIARISLRLITRRRLYLDDGLLFFAFACLCGASGIMFKRLRVVYLEFAVLSGLESAYSLAYEDMGNLVAQNTWEVAWLVLCWTAIFAVKWCYFAFFYPLLRNMSTRFTWYYRVGIFLSVACWITICVAEQLITCPYLGAEAGEKCFPTLPASHTSLMVTFWFWPVLDVMVDVIIVSIPILLLRRVQLDAMTKIGIGCFVCLSVFMSACAITRAAGTYYHGSLDYPWQNFWLHIEACIAVLMGSITAYRSTLIGSNEVSGRFQAYVEKFKRSLKRSTVEGTTDKAPENAPSQSGFFGLPRLPRGLATFSGLKTRFGLRSTHGATLPTTASLDDEFSDYHAFLKSPPPVATVASSKSPASREMMQSMGSSTTAYSPNQYSQRSH